MKINCHNPIFSGLGDLVIFAWLSSSLQASGGAPLEFYATGWRAEALTAFQQRVMTDRTGAISPQSNYEVALLCGFAGGYLDWIAKQFGIAIPHGDGAPRLHRPGLNLIPMEREMGRKATARVLIFPETSCTARTWPLPYWLELCQRLKEADIDFAVVTEQPMPAFSGLKTIHAQSISFVAAAVQMAKLVIGSDSGPAHLAGTLGVPALAIQGPTDERIYSYLPEVISFRKKALPCAGCYRSAAFRVACYYGCQEMYRTLPEDVLAKAMEMLEGRAPSRPGTDRAVPSKKKGARA